MKHKNKKFESGFLIFNIRQNIFISILNKKRGLKSPLLISNYVSLKLNFKLSSYCSTYKG